jgi:RNA polymerase sigma factor (sigma-70 family)
MRQSDDADLLSAYASKHSEQAFSLLVERYVALVYSAAWRQVENPHLAQEVTQAVFIILAKKAATLSQRTVLSGWLCRTAHLVARNALKTEHRRQHRENEAHMQSLLNEPDANAWAQLAPLLDEAVAQLSDPDRNAVVLRFYQHKPLNEVASILGVNPDAAQKRVSRAVDKLRKFFSNRGVTLTAAALGSMIASNSVQAVPAGLEVTIAAATVKGAAVAASVTALANGTIKTIAMTTLQKAFIATTIVAAGVATPLAVQHQNKLGKENESLRLQIDQQAQLAAENERLSKLITDTVQASPQLLPEDQLKELLRLRGEVGRLRTESRELARVKAAETQSPENQLRRQLAQMPEKNIPELQLLDNGKWSEDANKGKLDTEEGVRETLAKLRRTAKMRFVLTMGHAMEDYVKAANGQLPGTLSELTPYFKPYLAQPVDEAMFQRYELLHTGSLSALPAGEFLIGEKAPVDDRFDTLFKIGADSYTMQGIGKWSHQDDSTNKWKF